MHEISKAAKAFESEPSVAFGFVDSSKHPDMADKYYTDHDPQQSWLQKYPASFTRTFLTVLLPERAQTCLLPPGARTRQQRTMRAEPNGGPAARDAVAFLNEACRAHRREDGGLTPFGETAARLRAAYHAPSPAPAPRACRRLPVPPTPEQFLREFVATGTPAIIEGGLRASSTARWTADYLREKSGGDVVAIKVSPDGRFEGAEPAADWEDAPRSAPPDYVLRQLESPHKVIPRPAELSMNMSEFLDRLQGRPGLPRWNATLYLEYFALRGLAGLEGDVSDFGSFASFLHREHTNVWIGDGRAVGRLHFDPFENLLAQVSGGKNFTLFAPLRNEELYEGHMREAETEFDPETGRFRLRKLLDSTRMVMSPVDLSLPHQQVLAEYPLFERAWRERVQCDLKAGEILYLPAFWWHEVRSVPDRERVPQNIAVNLWYAPLWAKDFPCRRCRPYPSPRYRDDLVQHGL